MNPPDSLNFRKDGRSIEQFAQDIKEHTNKEKLLMALLHIEMHCRGWPFKYESNGIDNTGGLVKENTDCRADFYVHLWDKKFPCEVKNSPVLYKCTFKTYDLKQYIKDGTHIALFYGTGYINKNFENIKLDKMKYAFISPSAIQRMLNGNQTYKEPAFGNKNCVKILKEKYKNYFYEQKLHIFSDSGSHRLFNHAQFDPSRRSNGEIK